MTLHQGRDAEDHHYEAFHNTPEVQLALDLLATYQEWEEWHPEMSEQDRRRDLARGACFIIIQGQPRRCNLAYLLRVLWYVVKCWWRCRR